METEWEVSAYSKKDPSSGGHVEFMGNRGFVLSPYIIDVIVNHLSHSFESDRLLLLSQGGKKTSN